MEGAIMIDQCYLSVGSSELFSASRMKSSVFGVVGIGRCNKLLGSAQNLADAVEAAIRWSDKVEKRSLRVMMDYANVNVDGIQR